MIHRGTYDGTIYHNPVNKFCIISVKTADKEVPQEARSTRRYRDHLIRFVATGYELPRTDAVELELDGEWTKGKYGVQLQVEQWREIVPKTRDGGLSGLRPHQRHRAGNCRADRFPVWRGNAGYSAKSPRAAAGGQGHYGKQAGGHQNLVCGEPDAPRPDDAALPIQDHAENGPKDLPALWARQCGYFEKESL